jgi:hypothetical protein
MCQVIIDDLKQEMYLFANLSTFKVAADALREYLTKRDQDPEVAAAFLEKRGFLWMDDQGLPEGEIIYVCLWEGGAKEEKGVYEMDAATITGLDLAVDMPHASKWSIQAFLDSFP